MSVSSLRSVVLIVALGAAAPLQAASVALTWSGQLAIVLEDTGGGQLSGTPEGAAFVGGFVYDDVPGTPDPYPFGTDYPLTGVGGLQRSAGPGLAELTVVGGDLLLSINDNEPLNDGPAELINLLVVPDPPAVPGQPTDAWSLGGVQAGASRGESGDTVFNGVAWDVIMLSLGDTLYDSLAFRALPPGFGDVDVRAVLVTEGDASGNTVFQGLILLDDLTVVPVPPALGLLGSGLVALGLARRRHRV